MADTTIRVSEELAEELYQRKGRGTSYEDYIWQLLEAEEGHENTRSEPEETAEPQPIERTPGAEQTDSDTAEGVGHILGTVDSPGFRRNPEQFIEAIQAAVELLESGPQTKSQFVDEIYPDHPVGYDNTDTWWRRVGRPGLKAHPHASPPPSGASKWSLDRD